MKYRILYIVVISLICVKGFSQSIVWEKLNNYDPLKPGGSFNSISQDDSNSVVCFGARGANSERYFVNYDKNGNIKWIKPGFVNSVNTGEIIKIKSGDYLIGTGLPAPYTFSYNFTLQKLTSNGDTLLHWKYGENKTFDYVYGLIELPDGEIMAAGVNGYNYALLKVNSAGDSIWFKEYPSAASNSVDYCWGIMSNEKGNFVLYGYSDNVDSLGTSLPYFIEVSPNGDTVRTKLLKMKNDATDERAWWPNLIQTLDNNYLYAVTSDSLNHATFVHYSAVISVSLLDSSFNKKWTTILRPSGGKYYEASKVRQLKDSTYIILATYNEENWIGFFDLYKLNNKGIITSKFTFTSALCDSLLLNNLVVLNDSSIVITGECGDYQGSYIAKIDSIGAPAIIDTCKTFTASFKAQQNGDSLQFINTSKGGYDYAKQSIWKFADSTSSTIFSPKMQVVGTIDSVWARLTATNGYGCSGMVAQKVKVAQLTAVNQNAVSYSSLSVNVFPNPFAETTVFKIDNSSNSSYQLKIFNSLGEEISSYNFSENQFSLNASDFSSGLYMYVLRDGEGKMKSGKLVVE